MAYEAFRKDGGPTLYPSWKTPVTVDVTEWGFIYAAIILAISFLVVLPGARSKGRIGYFIRVCFGVYVTAAIMLINFGQEWETAYIHTKTQYKAGIKEEIQAEIGVKIGLRSVNITLKGVPERQRLDNQTEERINYNERFSWNNEGWTLGRVGFGPYAGRFNQEFRAAQFKGLPYPILWIAEYFTIDGEGIRWGRFYLQAGFYAHAMVWTALPMWIVGLVLLYMVTLYGGLFILMTGGCLLLSNILYASIRNRNALTIPFEDAHLEFKWGSTFWLCLVTGLMCTILGLVIMIMDVFFQEYLYRFFGFNLVKNLEEYYVKDIDHQSPPGPAVNGGPSAHEATTGVSVHLDDDNEDIYVNPDVTTRKFRSRTQMFTKRFGKGAGGKRPVPAPRGGGGQGHKNPAFETTELKDVSRSDRPTLRPPNNGAAAPVHQESLEYVQEGEDEDAEYENWTKETAAKFAPPQ